MTVLIEQPTIRVVDRSELPSTKAEMILRRGALWFAI